MNNVINKYISDYSQVTKISLLSHQLDYVMAAQNSLNWKHSSCKWANWQVVKMCYAIMDKISVNWREQNWFHFAFKREIYEKQRLVKFSSSWRELGSSPEWHSKIDLAVVVANHAEVPIKCSQMQTNKSSSRIKLPKWIWQNRIQEQTSTGWCLWCKVEHRCLNLSILEIKVPSTSIALWLSDSFQLLHMLLACAWIWPSLT